MKNTLKLTLIASSIAVFGCLQAQQPQQQPMGNPSQFQGVDRRGEDMRSEIASLNLSEQQKMQIHQIHEGLRTKFEAKEEELKAQHETLMRTTPADKNFDRIVKEEAESAAHFTEESILVMGKVKKDIFAILNPTQQQQVVQNPFLLDTLANPRHEHERGGFHGGQNGEMNQPPPPGQGFTPPSRN